jgi:DNA-binding MarR family transcriptional regulator
LFGISTAQARTIACLAHQAFLTQAQLAHRLHYDFASVSRLISRLVAAGIAVKNRCADERRCWCISLTERGAGLVPDIAAVLKAVDWRASGNLTDDEEHFFLALLRRLLVNAVSHTAEITTGVAGVADQVGEWPAAPDFYNAGCAVGW